MKAILTSALGGYIKTADGRIPDTLLEANGLVDTLRSLWKADSKVMIICGSPDNHDKNDSILSCLSAAFPMSGLSVSQCVMCDGRSRETIDRLPEMDVLVLAGGHVPTQNTFMKELRLKEKLQAWNGLLLAWSAGSMNCAETVYAGPELPGEAVDPEYQRWISGLGVTQINIFPHFEALRDEMLDGMRLIEDITYSDSFGHEIIALNNGSYILIKDGRETLCGEAYRILDGKLEQICADHQRIQL